jgi:beta-phosphoglucomutase-like phosphatase (HAD superfamily)
MKLDSYDIFAFDFDGTLVDSHGAYRDMDRIFIQQVYGAKMTKDFFCELETWFRTKLDCNYLISYYLMLDHIFGDGKKTAEEILEKTKQISEEFILPNIKYRPGCFIVLKMLRSFFTKNKFALVTGSKRHEIDYFSNNPNSSLKGLLAPNDFFDVIITKEDVEKQKPSPESYNIVLKQFGIENPSKMLVFEDSLSGVKAAKETGAAVAVIYNKYMDPNKEEIIKMADFYFKDWNDFTDLLLKVKK